VADEDFEDELLLGSSQESPADRWLTDEEYASGKWYRFALERLLPLAQSTRLTTAQMEFLARSGWICYVPRYVWVPRYVETNEFAKEETKIIPLFNEDGTPILIRGRIVFLQGPNQVPSFLAVPRDEEGKSSFSKILGIISRFTVKGVAEKPSEADRALLRKHFTNDGKLKPLDTSQLVRVRYWIPTPILGESFVQAPRLPFDMIPKIDLEEEYEKELQEKATNPTELVDYQYCGCPGLDEELIRAYRTNSEPRLRNIPLALRARVAAGEVLWEMKRENGVIKGIKVARGIENEAGITMRVHRRVAGRYITARQVFEGLERLKRHYFDPAIEDKLRYKPIPADFPEIDGIVIGNIKGVDVLEVERWVRSLLVRLSKTDPIAAARLQRKIRKDFEDWIEQVYDRTLPNEQLHYREWFYDLQMLAGNDWASQADRWHYQMQLRIHFKKAPGIISSTSQRANFLEMELQVADFESWRNLEHMQEHWKFTKAFHNLVSAFNPDKNAPSNMRQRDWGGIWNPWRAELDWRWNKLHSLAPKNQPELRRQLLNPAWFDKEPWQVIDHDGSLIDRFGQKKVSWVEAMSKIKGLSSAAGTGSFPKRKDGVLDKTLAEFRNYKNEYQLLLYDEYFARDPVDVIENQKGIVIFSIMDDVNLRIAARYDRPGKPRLFRLTYDTACQHARFVELMWKLQPVAPIKKAVEGAMKRWKRENVEHFRPLIDKMIEGLYLNSELKRELERWYRESDERYWDFVYYKSEMMSTWTDPGSAWSFETKDASKVISEGFGTGYGPVEMWQHRQEHLMEVALYTGYFSVIKGVLEWWSVKVTATKLFDERSWPDINELKLKVAGLLESRKLIYVVARDLLWPQLGIRQLIPANTPFPLRMKEVDSLDQRFIYEILGERAGTDYIPTAKEAEDSDLSAEVREEQLRKNARRFFRIASAKFFEINQ